MTASSAPSQTLNQVDAEAPWVSRIVGFIRFVRNNGFQAGIQEELDALKLAEQVNITRQKNLRWGLRSLLCSDREEWHRFDELFDAYWREPNRKAEVRATSSSRIENRGAQAGQSNGGQVAETDKAQEGDDNGDAGEGGSRGGASLKEIHSRSDFRLLSDEQQMREMERLVERLARKMRRHVVRRQHLRRHGRRIHLRRTIRSSLRYGGMPLDLYFMRRRRHLPRLILLLDVSRSMSIYSYLFLRFARGIVAAFKDADAFVYHTRLVHVTDALRERDIELVKEKLAIMSSGWNGGTRIGECLQNFNHDYGRRIVNSRSIVVIVSDGYDTGEPGVLAQQLGELKRRARKIVWLNPLLGREGYEPIARGMQEALPFIDLFASANNLDSLLALESYLTDL
jgi:uncharacterized protein with von Willebrand factor type A (vWA) domain